MAFILPYECEYCGHTITCRKQDLPDICPECNDTGDIRSNIEKYGCKSCEYLSKEFFVSCSLVPELNVRDINCPKESK